MRRRARAQRQQRGSARRVYEAARANAALVALINARPLRRVTIQPQASSRAGKEGRRASTAPAMATATAAWHAPSLIGHLSLVRNGGCQCYKDRRVLRIARHRLVCLACVLCSSAARCSVQA